jgi:ATP-dependent Clp protease, protease subunit
LKKRLISILAHHTGKPIEQIQNDSDRDYWITAQQAKDYGLVDEVVKSRKDVVPEQLPAPTTENALPA